MSPSTEASKPKIPAMATHRRPDWTDAQMNAYEPLCASQCCHTLKQT